MLLFGLEGSGFIISLSLTLLMAGAIMFYCLRRFKIIESSLVEQGKILQTFIIRYQTGNFPINNNLEAPGALVAARKQMELIESENNKIEVSDDENNENEDNDDETNTSDSEYSEQSTKDEENQIQEVGTLESTLINNCLLYTSPSPRDS